MTEKLNLIIDEPFHLPTHGVDRADEGGAQVIRFRPSDHGVVATPIPAMQRQRESRVVPIRPDYERRLTPMTAYDHTEHLRAIAGDGLISESLVQRRERQRKEAQWRLKVWCFLIIPFCLAGWLLVAWSVLQVIEHLRS